MTQSLSKSMGLDRNLVYQGGMEMPVHARVELQVQIYTEAWLASFSYE